MSKTAYLLLRAGAAFAFLYPALDAFADPASWLGYFPAVVRHTAAVLGIPNVVLLHGFGAVEVIIALWILSGKKIFWPSLAATLLLFSIIISDPGDFQVLFRDVSLAALTSALALMNLPNRAQAVVQ